MYARKTAPERRFDMHGIKERAPQTGGRVIRHAWLYDLLGSKMSGGRDTLVELADPQLDEVVLDVGCGTGTVALAIASGVGTNDVTGIDASPQMIEMARRKAAKAGSGAKFQVAAIEDLPFADGTFDLVTSSLMLHHLPADLKPSALAEVRRVLKPGGRFVVMDFARESHSPAGHLLSILGRGRGPATAENLVDLLTSAGFRTAAVLPSRHSNLAFVRAI
jgi:demethylmenaquinone methyltransferase/2-methoxy-6-polyprenyl-1,4-benzoquinol methylase/phosphoethanolamine N-methyltransferase